MSGSTFGLRQRTPVNYLQDNESTLSSPISVASPIPSEYGTSSLDVDQEDEDDNGSDASPTPTKPRRAVDPSDRSLRPRSSPTKLNLYVQPRKTTTKNAAIPKVGSDTARNRVRREIESVTRTKENNFLLFNKSFFQPLLPDRSFISHLMENQVTLGLSGEEVTFEELDVQPAGVTATLKPYQLSGLSFLVHLNNNGTSGLLGDEMGLGKTLQTLSLFQYLEEKFAAQGLDTSLRPYLVVCPLSVLGSWMAEAQKWVPQLKVIQFHGSAKEREAIKKGLAEQSDRIGHSTVKSPKTRDSIKLVITTYETFESDNKWFKSAFVWRYVVLDEGHKIKCHTTETSKALQGIKAEHRLILTGTPLQNNLLEMWALLHWLFPTVFIDKTADLFQNSFNLSKGQVHTGVMDDARRILELICLRRMKDSPEVNLGLPPKEEVLLFVPLTPMQRFWYTRFLTGVGNGVLEELFRDARGKEGIVMRKEAAEMAVANGLFADETAWEEQKGILQDAIASEKADNKDMWRRLMNLVMQLRKICSHPYMIPTAQPEPYFLGDHITMASGKFIVLRKLLEELVIRQGKKVLIFSGFTSTLDLTEDLLAVIGGDFKYGRFDGGTCRAKRNLVIRMFNSMDEYKVMLISTRAGGLGINLATATEVVFLDEDWNPQITLQAEARAHRIGQTKPVTIYKLCTQGTVEEQMLGRIRKKLYLSKKITESMKSVHDSPTRKKGKGRQSTSTEDMPQLDTSTLKSLIRRGAQTLSRPKIDETEMLSWDVETILEKCRDKPGDSAMDAVVDARDHAAEEQEWLAMMERVEAAVFEGREVVRNAGHATSLSSLLPDSVSRADRRKGKNTTVMVDGFAVTKESMNCGEWEAVPTLAGKDPRLAEPIRRKKGPVNNQEHCQICWDGGELVLCQRCPRSFHVECLSEKFQAKCKGSFYCPQHSCVTCEKTTSDAGGMIFRCRWCQRGHCENCLDFDKSELIGDTLVEYETAGHAAEQTAFYVVCQHCSHSIGTNPNTKSFYDQQNALYEKEHHEMEKRTKKADAAMAAAKVEKNYIKSQFKPSGGSALPSSQSSGSAQREVVDLGSESDNNGRERVADPGPHSQSNNSPNGIIDTGSDFIDLGSNSGTDDTVDLIDPDAMKGLTTASTLTLPSVAITPRGFSACASNKRKHPHDHDVGGFYDDVSSRLKVAKVAHTLGW